MHPHETPSAPGSARVSSLPHRAEHGGAAPAPAVSAAGGLLQRGKPKPVTHDGVEYPSRRALERALGLASGTVSKALRLGRMATLGAGSAYGRACGWAVCGEARVQPCAAAGWWWPSQKAAAKALGTSDNWVCNRLAEGRFEAFVIKRLGVRE